ncbi:MAG: flavin reductase [Gemmatimonadales bacterium]|nr:MAG: flavin reductase [Gemmatimonadales bacterium]
MTVEPGAGVFREVMGCFATGVAVVAGMGADGEPRGFTANAVTSVSLDPLLILISVGRSSSSLPALLDAEAFAVSFLRARDREVATRFAVGDRRSRFSQLPWRREVTGSPVLEDALAWLDCSLWKVVEAGDHQVLFGKVEACGLGEAGEPLLYYRGGFGVLGT